MINIYNIYVIFMYMHMYILYVYIYIYIYIKHMHLLPFRYTEEASLFLIFSLVISCISFPSLLF